MNGMRYFTAYAVLRGSLMGLGSFFLIKPFGLIGAALPVLLANVIDLIYVFFVLKQFIGISFSQLVLEAYYRPTLIGIAAGSVIYFVHHDITTWLWFVGAGSIYSAVFIALCFLFKIFDDREKEIFQKALTKIRLIKK
jgi:hypothetical protein